MPRLLLIALMLFLNTGCKHATATHVPVDPGFDDYESDALRAIAGALLSGNFP